MDRKAPILTILVAAAIGAVSSWAYMATRSFPTLEETALTGLMDNLTLLHYIKEGSLAEATNIGNLQIHLHLSRLRMYGGGISGNDWNDSTIRVLSAIAVMWEAEPAATDQEIYFIKEPWASNWEREVAENNALLSWVLDECRKHLEYDCKSTEGTEDGT